MTIAVTFCLPQSHQRHLPPSRIFQARFLQCGFWPRSSQIPISILLWILRWIFSSCFSKEKGPKKSTKTSPVKFTRKLVRKNSPWISAEAFSRTIATTRVFYCCNSGSCGTSYFQIGSGSAAFLKPPCLGTGVNGVGRGGGQADFNQIPWNPVKIWLKSGWNPVKVRSKSLEIMCFQTYKAYPDRAEKVKSG